MQIDTVGGPGGQVVGRGVRTCMSRAAKFTVSPSTVYLRVCSALAEPQISFLLTRDAA